MGCLFHISVRSDRWRRERYGYGTFLRIQGHVLVLP